MSEKWTKEAAIQRLQENKDLQVAMYLAPDLADVIEAAKQQENAPGYVWSRRYSELRNQAARYVGFNSFHPMLQTSAYYDAAIRAIDDLLPPDDLALYPNGRPDQE